MLSVRVLCACDELDAADTIPDDMISDPTEDEDIRELLLEVFGTGLCVAETVFLVVVELASTELENTETTFEVVELATDIDEDDSSLLLGPLATRFCIVELLLPVMLGCITIEMDVDSGAVEFFTTADVCPASEETNVVVFEAGDGAKSVGLEVEGTKFVAFNLLPFPETLDVNVIAKEPELDPVDAIAEFDETEIGLGREAPEAPETVVDSEELLTRLIDQLSDRLGVSLVIERM